MIGITSQLVRFSIGRSHSRAFPGPFDHHRSRGSALERVELDGSWSASHSFSVYRSILFLVVGGF